MSGPSSSSAIRTVIVSGLLSMGVAGAAEPPLSQPERVKLTAETLGLGNEINRLRADGKHDAVVERTERLLANLRRRQPPAEFPDGSPFLANALAGLGDALIAIGATERGLERLRESAAMSRRLYPAAKFPTGHIMLAQGLANLAVAMRHAGQIDETLPLLEEALAMARRHHRAAMYPGNPLGLRLLAGLLNNLGAAHAALGAHDKAITGIDKAVTVSRDLYPAATHPHGHADLAATLDNAASLLQSLNERARARTLYAEGLAMRRRLFPAATHPDGHLALVTSLNNLGSLDADSGALADARGRYAEAVALARRLFPPAAFPRGHEALATVLHNLGEVELLAGATDRAEPLLRESLAMRSRLVPSDGHAHLAQGRQTLGRLHLARREPAAAIAEFDAALAIANRLERRQVAATSEADALAYLHSRPMTRDWRLSAAPRPAEDGAAYATVWDGKALVTRVLARRQATARLGTTDAADSLRVVELRRRIERLMIDDAPSPERDRRLADLSDESERRERDLARRVPSFARAAELERSTADDLAAALPADAVFVDAIAYDRFAPDGSATAGQTRMRTPSYAAIVVARGRPARRVELGAATAIDADIGRWRRAIAARETSPAAAALARAVWTPLVAAFPPGTRTVHLAPDGALARLPWAALPSGPSRVVLEDFSVVVAPHGPWLLEALRDSRPRSTGGFLLVGGLDYGDSGWSPLPGAARERAAIERVATSPPAVRGGREVTAAWLAQELPKSRVAHLATHGRFDETTASHPTAAPALLGGAPPRRAVRNPMGQVGLVLSGGEVVTGLSLLDLHLENLHLAVLSACESGLGGLGIGEGVFGLTRAFHLAGAENVIASLWNVNDSATSALMAKFYHELWVNKREPLAALREAQLMIYRHPELIPDLAGERGAPKAKEALAVKPLAALQAPAKLQAAKRADTKLWAAFVLSGAGQ